MQGSEGAGLVSRGGEHGGVRAAKWAMVVRGEYKIPGGKLVGVNVGFDEAGRIAGCRIDGDFFVDGTDGEAHDLMHDLEGALVRGACLDAVLLEHANVRLIGVDAGAMERAFRRAVQARRAAHVDEPPDEAPGATGAAALQTPETRAAAPHKPTLRRSDGTTQSLWRQRWAALHPNVIHDRPRAPAEQMDLDVRWARMVASGRMAACLRVWEWNAPAVVIGRFQSLRDEVNLQEAEREHIEVVRRCTGGGAMFIEPGSTITYSLYASSDFVKGVGVERSYELCDQWLVDALRGLGIKAEFSGINDIASDHGKIGGAAQRRFPPRDGGPGSILHHVTLAYDIDAEKMARILNTSGEKMSDKAVKSAVRRVDPLRSQTGLSRQGLVSHLLDAAMGKQSARREYTT